jgi:hypothetical protein
MADKVADECAESKRITLHTGLGAYGVEVPPLSNGHSDPHRRTHRVIAGRVQHARDRECKRGIRTDPYVAAVYPDGLDVLEGFLVAYEDERSPEGVPQGALRLRLCERPEGLRTQDEGAPEERAESEVEQMRREVVDFNEVCPSFADDEIGVGV